MINYHINELQKSVINHSLTFLGFSFLTDCYMSVFFSFLINVFADFEKLTRFHRQAFIVYKNGKNLEILIETFYQKTYI